MVDFVYVCDHAKSTISLTKKYVLESRALRIFPKNLATSEKKIGWETHESDSETLTSVYL